MKKILPFILFATLLLSACASARNQEAPSAVGMGGGGGSTEPYAGAPIAPSMQDVAPSDGAVSNQAPATGGVEASNVERMVIQNADVAIVVNDVKGRMTNIQTMAEQMGGYVVSSNLYQTTTSNGLPIPGAQITIRVPAEKLDEALDKIKADVVDVQNETRTGQDVTAEYVDLQSRLKNYEAAEAQLEEIMKEAQNPDDVVNIFNQLVYYREQIELVKGQMKYYEEASKLSSINIQIIAKETIQPIEIAGWEPQGVARDAIQSLIYFYQDFVDFLINFFLLYLPVCLTLLIPLYLVFLGGRAVYRRVRGVKKEQVVEEKK
jgi:hypothetical protein